MSKKIILLFVSIFFSANLFAQTKTLPDITLTNLSGQNVNLKSLADSGKIVVIDFWATWCIPCQKSLTNMMDVKDDWKKNYNCEIIALSIDDAQNTAKVKTTVTGKGWDYSVLLDPNQQTKQSLNYQNIPFCIVVDGKGNIVYTHQGYVDGDENLLEEEIKKAAGK